MNAAKLSAGSLALLLAIASLFLVFPQGPAVKKPAQLEKDTWRYEVEAILAPATERDVAIYRIRVWTPVTHDAQITHGGTTVTGRMKVEPGGQIKSVQIVLLAEINPPGPDRKLMFQRRIEFRGGGEKGTSDFSNVEVPKGTELKDILKIAEGSGTVKIGQKLVLGRLKAEEVSLGVYLPD